MKYSTVIIIYNPASTGPSHAMAQSLKDDLMKSGLQVETVPTKKAGHASELAYNAAKTHTSPLVVSSSGDGGYNEVINGIMRANSGGARAVAAVLTAGNANDHGSELQDRPLAGSIKRGKVQKIDLLKVSTGTESRFAHSYVGVGITPVVAVELNRTTLSALKEAWLVTKSFTGYRPFKVETGGEVKELDSLVFSNISRMAKVLTVGDDIRPDDGTMSMVLMPRGSRFRFIWKTLQAIFGRVEDKKIKSFSFKALQAMPIQLDGEIMKIKSGSTVKIELIPRALPTIF